jgi:hypothetical protein
MTPARFLTVCVGISAYRSNVFNADEQPPRFAADSARDLSRRFTTLWPGHGSRHLLLVDEAATLANVGSVIAAETEHYDCFVLYLGGHGRAGSDAFGFIFFGEEPVSAGGSASIIDAMVAMPDADNVLLLLDCCDAAQYGEETAYFHAASTRGTRLCIASCTKGQKSREDPRLRRSIFADAILGVLATADGPDRVAGLDRGKLFDAIASEVSRQATALNGGVAQEPCLVSSSHAAAFMPAVRQRGRSKQPRSADRLQLLCRLKIPLASLIVVVASVAILMITTWHPAINRTGYVELRSGPKWLSFPVLGVRRVRVETDATHAELVGGAVAPGPGVRFVNDPGIRPWPGVNAAQVRRWADVFVDEYLNPAAGARWRIRLGYADADKSLVTHAAPGGDAAYPPNARSRRAVTVATATELAAEARILDPARPLADVWRLQWSENVVPGSCVSSELTDEARQQLHDFLRHSRPDSFIAWLRGLALTARVDEAVGLEEVVRLAEMFAAANAVWRRTPVAARTDAVAPVSATRDGGRSVERPSIDEVAALTDVASAIVARRIAASREAVTRAERARLLGILGGCSEIAMPVLAALGHHGDPARVIAWARARPASELARYCLRELAVHGALPGSEIIWHLHAQGFSGEQDDRKRAFNAVREWLAAVTDATPLSPDVLVHLVTYADERLTAGDIEGARQALAVILRSPYAAQPPVAAEISRLIGRIIPPQQPRKMPSRNVLPVYQDDLELLGLLARSGATLTDEQRNMIMNVLDRKDYKGTPRVHYSEHDRNGSQPPPQLVIVVNSAHLLALSRFMMGAKAADRTAVNMQTLNFLQQAIADAIRFGVSLDRIRDVITAAALVARKHAKRDLDAASVSNKIRRLAADAAARKAEVEITKAALAAMPKPQSALVVENLRTQWRREQEPEARLALAEIIIGAIANR